MAKHRERSLAFQALYGLSFSPVDSEKDLSAAFLRSGNARRNENADPDNTAPPSGFAWELTRGVWLYQKELNAAIENFSRNWTLSRIGRLERILLQLALYEMLHIHTHPKIVMSECMELADEFGAGAAKRFVNGILDAAARNMNNRNQA